jgi:hypothetical protein
MMLVGLVGRNLVEDWWKSYNKAFDKTPTEQFAEDPMVVYGYLVKHCMGDY